MTQNLRFQKASAEIDELKEAIEDLDKAQTDLADYFCEEASSFKIEECFRSLHSFTIKFKKVCTYMTWSS